MCSAAIISCGISIYTTGFGILLSYQNTHYVKFISISLGVRISQIEYPFFKLLIIKDTKSRFDAGME